MLAVISLVFLTYLAYSSLMVRGSFEVESREMMPDLVSGPRVLKVFSSMSR